MMTQTGVGLLVVFVFIKLFIIIFVILLIQSFLVLIF